MGSDSKTPEISITPPEIPGFPLTKEFLEIAFDREVEHFSTQAGTNPGDNYLSIIHAINVVFKGEQVEKHYIIKCYPNHQARRDFLDQVNVFDKELFVYGEFLPDLTKLATDIGALDTVFSSAPFHAGNVVGLQSSKFKIEPWSKENFILMTDIRKDGFGMVDRRKGLSLDHAKLVLEELARLHAVSWAYKKQNKMRLLTDTYPCFKDNMYNCSDELDEQFKGVMEQVAQTSKLAVEESIGNTHPAYISFAKLLETDQMHFMRGFFGTEGVDEGLMEANLRIKPDEDPNYVNEPWMVLNHGDCWVNNLMFSHDKETKKPTKVTLVDFQIFRECCPTLDLAYFFFSSIRTSVLIPNLSELLRFYYDAVIRYCDTLKVEPFPGFTFENLERRYRRAELFGILVCLPLLNLILKAPEDSVDLDQIEATDMADMFGSVLAGSEKNALFKNELSATVLKLYEKGVI